MFPSEFIMFPFTLFYEIIMRFHRKIHKTPENSYENYEDHATNQRTLLTISSIEISWNEINCGTLKNNFKISQIYNKNKQKKQT